MKKLLCLAFAMLISISCFAYGESTTVEINSIPNDATDVPFRLALDLTGVKEHVFNYDVTINFSEATFGYAYTGEYKTDNVTNAIDYKGITGRWTDNEAKLQITCNETSDIIKVYVKDHQTSYLTQYNDDDTSNNIVTITSDNTTTKDALRTLNPSESLDVTYTAEGTIPIDALFMGTAGPAVTAADYIGQTKSFDILSFKVYITDEFGAGTENWV